MHHLSFSKKANNIVASESVWQDTTFLGFCDFGVQSRNIVDFKADKVECYKETKAEGETWEEAFIKQITGPEAKPLSSFIYFLCHPPTHTGLLVFLLSHCNILSLSL